MKRSSLLIGLLLVTATALSLAVGTTAARSAAAQPSGAPKLVVILVVDQLRADYLDRYGTGFTGGLRRLMEKGAWWTEAAFPYLNTVTCAGHATIGTGAFPYRHGMVLNTWYDREANAPTTCTEDERARNVSYNGLEDGEGHSAHRMRVRPLGEQIQRDGGRAVSLSLKPRSSIPLAGNRAEAVVWFDDRGGWSTSSAYASRPVPEIQRFVDANPITVDYAKVWERTQDASAYQGEDAAKGEGTTSGWTQSFPHPLGAPAGTPDGIF
ncbi:MAG TPA: alkaline phosphatase family protein, partial [Vicinamibacterales bacterium]|nr:alkaline phosphatase family protein [Vicinamibacterales bacterium]